ncbi:MAG TPA: TonB-dependent receptor [Terriglobales bacterium]|nr:TonB-dependent receptor [Terriglobales bacterium]
MSNPFRRVLMFLFAIVIFGGQLLFADVTAGVVGTVVDPSGAAVPNATVVLKNAATGLERRAITNSSGNYEFISVPVGERYSLEVEAPGFGRKVQTGIKLVVNQTYKADFKLAIGAVTQSVEVTGSATQVDTTNTQLGDVIEDKKMTTLPLNGRSYIDLLGLQAGVVPISSDATSNDRLVSGNLSSGNVSVNGQREAANSFLVNGGDVEEGVNNGASIIPTLDSIQEFRLLTSSFNAEYGRFSGAIVNVLTKSGTNEIHGSGYEFLRNDKLDARSFFDPERGVLRRNQFGGTLGGPILKNKLFVFGDYQGSREARGVSSGLIVVPSQLERTGNFSDLGTTGFSQFVCPTDADPNNPCVVRGSDTNQTNFPIVLGKRLGYSVHSGEPYWFPGCTTTIQCVFPGAAGPIIPEAAWSPVAKATLKFIPTPTGSQGGQPFFSSAAEKSNLRDDKWGLKVDLNTAHFGNWSYYYHFDDANYLSPYPAFTSNVPGFAAATVSRAQQIAVGNTFIINPNTVNELRLNYTRFAFLKNKPVGGLGKVTDFGYVEGGLGVIPSNPATEGVAPISFNQLGLSFGLPDGTTGQYNNTYQISDNFSKVMGNHTLKFGGDVRYLQINERNTYTSNGWFSFSGSETGNDFADFLLGAPDFFNQSSRQFLDSRTKYFGLYAQDTFKVRSDLTLNYGLRWDVSQPYYDTKNRIQTFVPGQQSTVYPDAPKGFVFPGDAGVPSTLAPTQYTRFAPRVGIAYSPSASEGLLGKIFGGPGKTSIRVGGGLYYTAIEDLTLFNEVGDPPFGLFYISPVPVYLEEPYKARTSQDPGQRFPFTIPAPGATGIWGKYLPIATAPTFKTTNKLPYAGHFNLTIQREVARSAVLTVGYVGSVGRHLLSTIESNPGNPATCLQVAAVMPTGQGCGPFGEDTIYVLPSGQHVNGTRPFSVTSGRGLANGQLDFQSNNYEATVANSSYNALQASLEKRLGNLRLLGAYTWSKSLDNSSGFFDTINPFFPSASRALSTFDVSHNFVISYSYDLPFTRSTHGFRGKALSGWMLSGITRFTTGFPVTLSEGDDNSLCGCGGADVPNYNGQSIHFQDPRASASHQFFSTSPFTPENIGVAGNSRRRFFHGPGINNWDLALHKNTAITERTALEFRAEFFNVFNHAQFTFSSSSGDIASSNFGQVTGARDGRIGQIALKLSF